MTVLLVILFRKKDYLMDDQEYYKKIKKINKENLYKQAKSCADKDERIISRIIENGLARYVQSRT